MANPSRQQLDELKRAYALQQHPTEIPLYQGALTASQYIPEAMAVMGAVGGSAGAGRLGPIGKSLARVGPHLTPGPGGQLAMSEELQGALSRYRTGGTTRPALADKTLGDYRLLTEPGIPVEQRLAAADRFTKAWGMKQKAPLPPAAAPDQAATDKAYAMRTPKATPPVPIGGQQ